MKKMVFFVSSLILVSNIFGADWVYNNVDPTSGTITDPDIGWVLNVKFVDTEPDLLTVGKPIGTEYASLDLSNVVCDKRLDKTPAMCYTWFL